MKIELTKHDKRFKAFRFIISATSRDKEGYCFSLVKVEDKRIVATSGKVLHVAEIDHVFEPGLYEVIINNQKSIVLLPKETNLKFPKWDDIMPTDYQGSFQLDFGWSHLGGVGCQLAVVCAALARVNLCVNSDFFRPIIDLGGGTWDVLYDPASQWGKINRPVLLKKDGLTALFMPFLSYEIEYTVNQPKETAEVA